MVSREQKKIDRQTAKWLRQFLARQFSGLMVLTIAGIIHGRERVHLGRNPPHPPPTNPPRERWEDSNPCSFPPPTDGMRTAKVGRWGSHDGHADQAAVGGSHRQEDGDGAKLLLKLIGCQGGWGSAKVVGKMLAVG